MGMKKTSSLKTAFWKFLIMLLLGLYIASCIAQQHGGKIRLQNSAETGGAMVIISVHL